MADGIIFRTVDMLRWGIAGGLGTGGNLTPLQFDENFWELLIRIQAIEGDPPEAISVSGFTVIGSQFQVNMSDGSTRGPYDLPIATFRFVGEWVNNLPMLKLDFVSKKGFGLYIVLISHTAPAGPATFDPAAVDTVIGSPTFGQPLYQLVYGEQEYIYDVGFFFPGKPGIGIEVGAAIAGHVFVHEVTFPATLPGSKADLKIDPASSMTFKIQRNGVDKGTVNFAAGANVGTFTFAADVVFAVGDKLTVLYPNGGIDVDARELSITFKAVRSF